MLTKVTFIKWLSSGLNYEIYSFYLIAEQSSKFLQKTDYQIAITGQVTNFHKKHLEKNKEINQYKRFWKYLNNY